MKRATIDSLSFTRQVWDPHFGMQCSHNVNLNHMSRKFIEVSCGSDKKGPGTHCQNIDCLEMALTK